MKKFFLLLALSLIAACNKSDEQTPQNINGAWRMVSVTGGIAGTYDEFGDCTITWTFEGNGNVSVVNNNVDQHEVDLIETGEYVYTFHPNPATPQNCPEALYIDGVSYGCYEIDGNTLTLSQLEADGYQAVFEKE